MLCFEWQVQGRSCACKCKVCSSVDSSSDSCGTHETVASHTSWHTPCAMSHVSHVPLMSHVASESNHTHESCHNRVMSHVCMSLVTQSARTYTFGFMTWQYFICVTWLVPWGIDMTHSLVWHELLTWNVCADLSAKVPRCTWELVISPISRVMSHV